MMQASMMHSGARSEETARNARHGISSRKMKTVLNAIGVTLNSAPSVCAITMTATTIGTTGVLTDS